ncbi:hypothetical protein OH76DRAFT_906829 [Lentinus brumalis]|uniref:Uncharacterized protein n=1 Tax=Lentinus brumalis TaxID=2498619 RepID=A0A371D0H2_9APHY|nr:hypothetical protein OH76DRAFT_906829 [Polyporus brumalis]
MHDQAFTSSYSACTPALNLFFLASARRVRAQDRTFRTTPAPGSLIPGRSIVFSSSRITSGGVQSSGHIPFGSCSTPRPLWWNTSANTACARRSSGLGGSTRGGAVGRAGDCDPEAGTLLSKVTYSAMGAVPNRL